MSVIILASSVDAQNASPTADVIIGIVAITIGVILGFDIRDIAATLRRNSTGFTRWGRRRDEQRVLNPVRVVGWLFLAGGVITFVLGIVRGIRS